LNVINTLKAAKLDGKTKCIPSVFKWYWM